MNYWRDAPCIGQTELFYSRSKDAQLLAKRMCASCPHAVECLAMAEAQGEEYGTWGGKSFDRPNRSTNRCGVCQAEFVAGASAVKFCGDDCRATAKRAWDAEHKRKRRAERKAA